MHNHFLELKYALYVAVRAREHAQVEDRALQICMKSQSKNAKCNFVPPNYITNGHGYPKQTTSCTWPYVVPIGEDPAAHGHWCAFTDLYHTMPWVCYRRRNQWLRLALASFCLPLTWLACVVYLLALRC